MPRQLSGVSSLLPPWVLGVKLRPSCFFGKHFTLLSYLASLILLRFDWKKCYSRVLSGLCSGISFFFFPVLRFDPSKGRCTVSYKVSALAEDIKYSHPCGRHGDYLVYCFPSILCLLLAHFFELLVRSLPSYPLLGTPSAISGSLCATAFYIAVPALVTLLSELQ